MDREFSGGCCLAIIIAIVLSFVVGILFFVDLIPAIFLLLGTGLIFAVGIILTLVAVAAFGKDNISCCVCKFGICLLIGAIGTIITSIIALLIDVFAGSIIIAILIGIFVFFFVLMIISFIKFILCLICKNCNF